MAEDGHMQSISWTGSGERVTTGAADPQRRTKLQSTELHDDVVELICSRVPYPALFRARALSKGWYFKLPVSTCSAISPPLTSFQKLVQAVSRNWPAYYPILFTRDKIIGYDIYSSSWRSVVTGLDLHRSRGSSRNWIRMTSRLSQVSSAGSLVCITCKVRKEPGLSFGYIVTVVNVVTRCERELKPPVEPMLKKPLHTRIVPNGADGYEVIVVESGVEKEREINSTVHESDPEGFKYPQHSMTTYIYDSRVKQWTDKGNSVNENVDLRMFFSCPAYFDGSFYGLETYPKLATLTVWIYNVEEARWKSKIVTTNLHTQEGTSTVRFGMFASSDRLIVCIGFTSSRAFTELEDGRSVPVTEANSVLFLELQPKSLELVDSTTGPHKVLRGGVSNFKRRHGLHISCHGNLIYMGWFHGDMVTFDFQKREWSPLQAEGHNVFCTEEKIWGLSAFDPGLNPFVPV